MRGGLEEGGKRGSDCGIEGNGLGHQMVVLGHLVAVLGGSDKIEGHDIKN
jgi:hypothetical protein